MGTELVGSHFSSSDLGQMFCLRPHHLGASSCGPTVHRWPLNAVSGPPPPTLPVVQLEAALAPTDGSCGSLRKRAQSPADIFLPAPSAGEEEQGHRGSTAIPLGPTPSAQVSCTSFVSQLSPEWRSVPPSSPPTQPAAPRWLGIRACAALRLQDRRTTCGWPTPPVSWVLRWAQSCPSDSASHSQSPQAGPKPDPSPTANVPSQAADRPLPAREKPGSWFQILRTDTPRPPCPSARTPELQGRGSPRGPGELPPRQSAPVPPSLSPRPPLRSPTSPGAALPRNSLGRPGPPRGR